MPATQRSIEIDASPGDTLAVLTDFEAYPNFLPDLQAVEVIRAAPGDWEVRFSLRLIRPLVYTLRLMAPDPLSLQWSLVEGAFKANDGSWTLEPLDGGARTRATYTIDVGMGLYVPGNIVRSLSERSLPDTLSRFKAEIERRAAH